MVESPTSAPAVSILIPCFNLGAFVGEALDSVYAQTRQDFEIVLVNDGSTDPETNTIVAELDRPRLTVLSTENRGLAAARNLAARHSRGRVLCALDADDKLHPEFLEKTLGVLEADASVTFVSTWVECFGIENWTWKQVHCDLPKLLAECVVLTASPVRREAFEAVGGFDETRFLFGSEDWDLWITLVERGFRGHIIPETLFYYRQRAGSMRREADSKPTRLRVWQTLLEKHRDSYAKHLQTVLLHKEEECGGLLLDNWRLEHELATDLEPRLARLETAVSAAGNVKSEPDEVDRTEELRVALQRARAEIVALRESKSWRVTAPLRRAYEVLLNLRSGGAGR